MSTQAEPAHESGTGWAHAGYENLGLTVRTPLSGTARIAPDRVRRSNTWDRRAAGRSGAVPAQHPDHRWPWRGSYDHPSLATVDPTHGDPNPASGSLAPRYRLRALRTPVCVQHVPRVAASPPRRGTEGHPPDRMAGNRFSTRARPTQRWLRAAWQRGGWQSAPLSATAGARRRRPARDSDRSRSARRFPPAGDL